MYYLLSTHVHVISMCTITINKCTVCNGYKKMPTTSLSSLIGTFDLLKRFVTSRTVVLALIVGCGLQMFQQLGGINTVM